MILGSFILKAFLLGVLGSLDSGGQTRACSVPHIRDKKGNEKKIIEVTSGKDVKLICQIRTSGQNPKPRYYWLKDNQTFTPSDHPRMRLKPLKYLKIKKAVKEDAGFYTCVAVNDCGENSYTMQLFVRSPTMDRNKNTTGVAPIFIVRQYKGWRNLAVPVGNSVKLDCSADGNPRPIVKWYKDGKLFKERKDGNKVYLSPWTTLLSLKNLVPSDTGSYRCNVSNSYGWINHTYKVDVYGPTMDPNKNTTGVAPIFTVERNKLRRNLLAVPFGNSVKLDCSADGNPRPIVKWYKDGKLFKERKGGSKVFLSPWTTVLVLKDLIPPDTGRYMCNVSNSYGWINHTYKVDVHERARAEPVVLPMENVTVYRGKNASLTCKALSDSMPHFQWLRWFPMRSNGSVNSSADGSIESPHYEIVDKDETDQHVITSSPSGKRFEFHGVKLTLVNVTKKDEGKYTCIVGNAVGYAVEQAYIIIKQSGR